MPVFISTPQEQAVMLNRRKCFDRASGCFSPSVQSCGETSVTFTIFEVKDLETIRSIYQVISWLDWWLASAKTFACSPLPADKWKYDGC